MPNNHPDAAERLTPPIASVDLWGPPSVAPTEGYTTHAPRKKKPWGTLDILWGGLALVGAQVAILPVLILLAVAKYDIQMDAPGAADVLTEAVSKVALSGPGLVLALLSQWAAFVGIPALASYRKGHRSLAKDFGFWFKRSDFVYGALLAVGMQALMMGISWLLHQTSLDLSGADNTNQVTDHVGVMLVIMVLAASIGAPITEELFFRGLVMRAFLRRFAKVDLAPRLSGVTDRLHDTVVSPLRRKVGVVASILLTSAFFGIMHVQTKTLPDGSTTIPLGGWVVVAQTGLLGLIFAVVAYRSKRIGLPIVAHFFFNSASLALVFATT